MDIEDQTQVEETLDTQEQETEELSTREAIEAVIGQTDDGQEEATEETVVTGGDETEAQASETETTEQTTVTDSDAVDEGKNLKAPVGWSAKGREFWSKLPIEAQQEITEREKHIEQAMANTKQARQTHDHFEKLATQYGGILAAQGVNPLQATESLFETAAQLSLGNSRQKAAVIAELIDSYDVDISTLDDVLVNGNVNGGSAETNDIDAALERKLGPLLNQIKQNQQQTQNARQESAKSEIATFAEGKEFFMDVKDTMADLIDVAQKQGKKLTLQEAYNMACQLDEGVASVLAQRKENENLLNKSTALQNKKKAASTLSTRRVGTGAGLEDTSIRGALQDAFEQSGRA